MRSPVLLGALMALVIGSLALAGLVAAVSGRPPVTPPPTSPPPGSSALGLYAPDASPTPLPTPTPAPTPGVGTQVGLRAPQLVLPALGGGEIDTAASAGRPLWINFMASWCPDCRDELPRLQSIDLQLGEELDIVLVDVGEDEATARRFLDSLDVELPTGIDSDGAAMQAWAAYVLPIHFFIDAEGVVQEIVYGGAPEEILLEALRTIMPDAEIGPGASPEGDPGVAP